MAASGNSASSTMSVDQSSLEQLIVKVSDLQNEVLDLTNAVDNVAKELVKIQVAMNWQ